MEVRVIETSAIQKFEEMFIAACKRIEEAADEKKFYHEKRLLSAKEVGRLTGFSQGSILKRKHEIGFFTQGKDIRFRMKDVEKWIEQNYIRPRPPRY